MMTLGFSQAMADRQVKYVLSDAGYILSRSEESDGAGGQEVTYEKGAATPCALAPVGGGEGTNNPGDRIDDRTTNLITVPAGTQVSEKDRIEIDGWGVFDVTAVRRRTTEIARQIEVMEAV
jgi:hypothetical protein